jgi:TIR domain
MARCRVYRSHRHSLGCGVSSREVGLMVESAAPVPGRVFISYRREETAYPAGWLYDRLANRYGGQVFKDVDSIQLGDDFVEVITRAVGSCDVLLALIGDQWLTITGEDGRRRLDDPDDFVRLEIEAALTRNVRVIPILVEGARLPRADELPPSLARLVRRQALELSPARFDFDTSRLLKVLDKTLAEMRTAHDSAAAVSAPAGKAADSGTAEPPRAPEQREQAEPSPTPSIQQTPATPPAVGPASEQSKPPDRSTTEVHEASERREPAESSPRVRPRRRRLVYAAAAALVLAAAGTAATLLILDRGDSPGEAGRPASNEITAAAAWRLVISNKIEAGNNGCTVTVTNTDTGDQKVFENIWGTKTFQMQTAGKFRWEANDSGCLVVQHSGSGKAVLPFSQKADTGDTDVFAAPKAPGKVAVQVLAFNSYGECDFEMHDAADGQLVDLGTVPQGKGPLRLEPNGRSQVYLADFAGCDVRVSAEP